MNKLSSYLNYLAPILLGVFLFAYPLLFTSLTTDPFIIPKQALLATVSILGLLILGLRIIAEKKIVLRRTPFDLPIVLFTAVAFVGSILSVNRSESLTAFVPLFFGALLYFLFTNFVKTQKALNLLIHSFLAGTLLSSVLYFFNFFKVYLLPFQISQNQAFTTLGSLLDFAIYTALALVLGWYILRMAMKAQGVTFKNLDPRTSLILGGTVVELLVFAVAVGLSIYNMIKLQGPVVLPFDTGFQVGFAAISQDTQRWLVSFLFGSGFGTFGSDFTRFKQAFFNQNPLWTLTFFRSSSFVLELLATTGVLGLLSYLFLLFRVARVKPMFVPFGFLALLSFVLPFSLTTIVLLWIVLGLYASFKGLSQDKGFYDFQLALVTLRNGFIAVSEGDSREVNRGFSRFLPSVLLILILLVVGFLGTLSVQYIWANTLFQASLVDASQNKGGDAYDKQVKAIQLVPYNDSYHRAFSQTNLALANSLSLQNKNASPSAQTQQTILTLIQQSINAGRNATILSPLTSLNWQNLASIYRALIGFGKDADKFAVAAQQQAVILDPSNPQEYINFGGLYYQLKDFDKAEQQFRIAVNLKIDFANAHYNLAHALQEKGDIQGAIDELKIVEQLVKDQPDNLKQVQKEISLLEQGLKTQKPPAGQPETQLPTQNPQVEIPAPATPTPTPTPTASPTPQPLK